MNSVVETSGLTKQFGRVRAVDGLDIKVERGSVYGFLGPNGAGKSTTIRMLVGLVRPTAGCVKLFGREVARDVKVLGKVGSLVETPTFYKYLSGRQNLSVLARGSVKSSEIDAVLEEVGILERAKDKVKTYSQGMRQRLGLAHAMLGDPELVILDEPTNGLDPEGMKEIRGIVRNLAEKRGTTVFLSSHLLHEVEQVCDRVGIISRGKLVVEGNIRDLTQSAGTVTINLDQPERAADALRKLEYVESVEIKEGSLCVRMPDDLTADLNAFLIENGFRVSVLVSEKRTLEDIYLSAMKDERSMPENRHSVI